MAVSIAAGIGLVRLVPVVSALVGREGLMRSISPDAPIRLEVCWESLQQADAPSREWAHLALKMGWERDSRVIFHDWGECQEEGRRSRGLRQTLRQASVTYLSTTTPPGLAMNSQH